MNEEESITIIHILRDTKMNTRISDSKNKKTITSLSPITLSSPSKGDKNSIVGTRNNVNHHINNYNYNVPAANDTTNQNINNTMSIDEEVVDDDILNEVLIIAKAYREAHVSVSISLWCACI